MYNSVKLMLVNYSQATVYVGSGEMEEGGGFLHRVASHTETFLGVHPGSCTANIS